jgi:putative thioredoxin
MDPRTTPAIPAVMRGAVDLSGLRDRATAAARSQARPTPPTPPAPAASTNGGTAAAPTDRAAAADTQPSGAAVTIIDVTDATFQTEVLERSLTTPVVIDFWAEWCGPCRQLSPVLEKLAIEGDGAWVLAKVDVDTNPRLSQMFRVQGIPMVFAVIGGQPVDAFTGVVPEAQLRPWIDAVLKAAGGAPAASEDPALAAADDALADGDYEAAERAYRKILADRPADAAAAAGLAQVGLMRRVEGIGPRAALEAADERPDDVAAQLVAADVEVLAGNAADAYARLVDLVRRLAGDDRDKVRAHIIDLFSMAAPDDPAVATARRALANALF